jgi:hypothetical protein
VLWLNEERAVRTDEALNDGLKRVVDVGCGSDSQIDHNGLLVHFSCALTDIPILSDAAFEISKRTTLLQRRVEMYQNREHSSKNCKKDSVGGGETCVTRYSYTQEWASEHLQIGNGPRAKGYANPSDWMYESQEWSANVLHAGKFTLPKKLQNQLTNVQLVHVEKLPSHLSTGKKWQLVENKVRMQQNIGTDTIGDLRVSFLEGTAKEVSVIAQQNGQNNLEPFTSANSYTVYLIEEGAVGAQLMIIHAHEANARLTWLLRLLGFAMLWVGLLLVGGPLSVAADCIPCVGPLLGDLISCGVCFASALIALPVSVLVIAAAWLAARPLYSSIAIIGVGAAIFEASRRAQRRRRRSSGPDVLESYDTKSLVGTNSKPIAYDPAPVYAPSAPPFVPMASAVVPVGGEVSENMAGSSNRSSNMGDMSVREWLGAITSTGEFTNYGQAFEEYGYSSTKVLMDAEEGDLAEAFDEMGVKKPHRRTLLREIEAMRLGY